MKKLSKVLAILGGIIGLIAVFLFFFEQSLGWWEVSVQIGTLSNSAYISPFGYTSDDAFLGPLFLFAAVLFILGSVLIFVAAAKDSKGFSIICSLLMIGGLILFCYSLYANEDFDALITGLETLLGSEFFVFFGTVDLGLFGIWTWRLGNGFFIACAGTVIALVGSFLLGRK